MLAISHNCVNVFTGIVSHYDVVSLAVTALMYGRACRGRIK